MYFLSFLASLPYSPQTPSPCCPSQLYALFLNFFFLNKPPSLISAIHASWMWTSDWNTVNLPEAIPLKRTDSLPPAAINSQ